MDVVIRLKELYSRRFIGTPSSPEGEREITWTPSYPERQRRPELSANAVIKGKVIWFNFALKGFRPQKIILFSTLDLTPMQLAELYGLRWNVELDLRDIKKTLGLEFLRTRTPEMVGKELMLAVSAFNLIRHCMQTAAKALKVDLRALSFTRVRELVDILSLAMLADSSPEEKNKTLTRAFTDLRGLVLNKRKRKRPTEPRKVWPRGDKIYFKSSTTRKKERDRLKAQAERHILDGDPIT